MVGGVADWFAVTALFRRPLGLPIPHTALIVERKDQFAATLGQFVQENFLNADVLAERLRSARLVPRLAAWLADDANAAGFAGQGRTSLALGRGGPTGLGRAGPCSGRRPAPAGRGGRRTAAIR